MKKFLISTAISLVFGAITFGAVQTSTQTPTSVETPAVVSETEAKEPEITTKEVVETETIPYETVTKDDNTLEKGTTKVISVGEFGERTKVYEVTYSDGKEVGRNLKSSQVTKEPVNRVVTNGTYVKPQPGQSVYCENGTYTNVDGQKVCRPSSSNTGGATAVCGDGTYSYSKNRRGTCSHHGGVSRWL